MGGKQMLVSGRGEGVHMTSTFGQPALLRHRPASAASRIYPLNALPPTSFLHIRLRLVATVRTRARAFRASAHLGKSGNPLAAPDMSATAPPSAQIQQLRALFVSDPAGGQSSTGGKRNRAPRFLL